MLLPIWGLKLCCPIRDSAATFMTFCAASNLIKSGMSVAIIWRKYQLFNVKLDYRCPSPYDTYICAKGIVRELNVQLVRSLIGNSMCAPTAMKASRAAHYIFSLSELRMRTAHLSRCVDPVSNVGFSIDAQLPPLLYPHFSLISIRNLIARSVDLIAPKIVDFPYSSLQKKELFCGRMFTTVWAPSWAFMGKSRTSFRAAISDSTPQLKWMSSFCHRRV